MLFCICLHLLLYMLQIHRWQAEVMEGHIKDHTSRLSSQPLAALSPIKIKLALRKQWTNESIEAVKNSSPVQRTAIEPRVARSTLQDRVSGHVIHHQ